MTDRIINVELADGKTPLFCNVWIIQEKNKNTSVKNIALSEHEAFQLYAQLKLLLNKKQII